MGFFGGNAVNGDVGTEIYIIILVMANIGFLFARRRARGAERPARVAAGRFSRLARRGQRGAVHLLLVVALVLGISLWGISEILQRKIDAETAIAEAGVTSLNEARGALLDYALSPPPKLEVENRAGSYAALIDGGAAMPHRFFALPCPDVASEDSNLDGVSDILGNDGNLQDCGGTAAETPLKEGARLGRLPWRTFSGGRGGRLQYVRGAGGNIKDNNHDRFWYYVSRNVARTDLALNPHWLLRQTDDWLSVDAQNGEVIPRIAAMVISPGAASAPRFSEEDARTGGLGLSSDAALMTEVEKFLEFDGSDSAVTINRPPQVPSDDEVAYLTIDELAASGGSGLERLAAPDSKFMEMVEGRNGYLGVKAMMEAHFNRYGQMPAPASFGRGAAEFRTRPSGISARTVVIGNDTFLLQDGAVNDVGAQRINVLVPIRNLQYVYLQEGTRFSGSVAADTSGSSSGGIPPFNAQLYDLETDLNSTPMLNTVVAALAAGGYYPQDNLFGYRADRRAFDGFGASMAIESPDGNLTVTAFVPDLSAPDAPADVRVFRTGFNPAATMALPVPRFQGGIVGTQINAALASPILGYLEGNNLAAAVRAGGLPAAPDSPQFGVQVRLPTGTRVNIDVQGTGITMELPRDLRMRRGGASFDPSTNTWELERQLASPVRIDANTDQVLTLGLMVADLPPKAGMMGFLPVDSHRADYLSPEGSVVLLTTANVLDYTLAVNGGSTVGLAQAVSNLPVEMEFFTNQRLALIPFPPPGRPAADANDRPPTTLTLTTSLSETLVRRERCAGESVLRSECREDGDGEGRLVSYLASGGVRFGAAGSCTLPQPTDVVQRECVGGVFMNTQRDGTIVPGGSCTVDSIPQPPTTAPTVPTNEAGRSLQRGDCVGGFRSVTERRVTGTLVAMRVIPGRMAEGFSSGAINTPTPLYVNYLAATIARTTLFSLPAGTQIYYPPGATLAIGSDFAFPPGARAFIPPRATMRVNVLPESTLPGGREAEGLQFAGGVPEREVYFEHGAVMDLFGPSAARANAGTRIVLHDGKGVDSTQELFDIEVQTDYRTTGSRQTGGNVRQGGMILQPLTGRKLEESIRPMRLPDGATLFAPRAEVRFLTRTRNLALLTQGNLSSPMRLTATIVAMSSFILRATTTTTVTLLTFMARSVETRTVTNSAAGANIQTRFVLGGTREIEPILPPEIAPDPQWNLGWRYRGYNPNNRGETMWVGGGVPTECRTPGVTPQCLIESGANPRNPGTRHWQWSPGAPVSTVTLVPCICDDPDYRRSRPVCAPDPWTGVPDVTENVVPLNSTVEFNCIAFNEQYSTSLSIGVTERNITDQITLTNVSQPLVSNAVVSRPLDLVLGAQAGTMFAENAGGADDFEINEETRFILPTAPNGGILLTRTTITSAAATITAVSEITLPKRTIIYDSSLPSLSPFSVGGRAGMAVLDEPLVLTLAHPIEGRGIVLDQLIMIPQTDFRVGTRVVSADSVVDLTRGRAWPPGAVRTLPHVAEDMRAVSSEPIHMYFSEGAILTNAGDFTLLREYTVPGSTLAAREDLLEMQINEPIALTMAWERHSSVYLDVDVTLGSSQSSGVSDKGEVTVRAGGRLVMPSGSFIVIPPGATLDYLSPVRHQSLTATLTPQGADFANLPLNAVAVFPPGMTTTVETYYEGVTTLTIRQSLTLQVPTGRSMVVGEVTSVVDQCLARPPLDKPVTVINTTVTTEIVQLDICRCDADEDAPGFREADKGKGIKWIGVVPRGECRAGADGRNNLLARDLGRHYSGRYPARDTNFRAPRLSAYLSTLWLAANVSVAGQLNLGGRDGSAFVTGTVLGSRHYLESTFQTERCKVDGEFLKLDNSELLPDSQPVQHTITTSIMTLGTYEQVATVEATIQTEVCECIADVRVAGLVRAGDCTPDSTNFLFRALGEQRDRRGDALDTDHCTGGHQLQKHNAGDARNFTLRVETTLTLLGVPTVVVTTEARNFDVERCECSPGFRRNGLVRKGHCNADDHASLGEELRRTGADRGPGTDAGRTFDANSCIGAAPESFRPFPSLPDDPTSIPVNYPATLTLPGPFPEFKFVNPLSGKVLTAGVTSEYHLVATIGGTERTITTPTYTVTNTIPEVPQQLITPRFGTDRPNFGRSRGEFCVVAPSEFCQQESVEATCETGADGICDCPAGQTPDRITFTRKAGACALGVVGQCSLLGSIKSRLSPQCVRQRQEPERMVTLTLDTPTRRIVDTPPARVTMQRNLQLDLDVCRCDIEPAQLAAANRARAASNRAPLTNLKYVGLVPRGECRQDSDGSGGTGESNVLHKLSDWAGMYPAADSSLPARLVSGTTPHQIAPFLNLGGPNGDKFLTHPQLDGKGGETPYLSQNGDEGRRCNPKGEFDTITEANRDPATGFDWFPTRTRPGVYNEVRAQTGTTMSVIATELCVCNGDGGLVRQGDCVAGGDFGWLRREYTRVHGTDSVPFILSDAQAAACTANGGPDSPPTTPSGNVPTSFTLPFPILGEANEPRTLAVAVANSLAIFPQRVELERCVCDQFSSGLVRKGDCKAGGDYTWLHRQLAAAAAIEGGQVQHALTPAQAQICIDNTDTGGGPVSPPTTPVSPFPSSTLVVTPEGLAVIKKLGGSDGRVYKDNQCKVDFSQTDTIAPGATLNFHIKARTTVIAPRYAPQLTTIVTLRTPTLVAAQTGRTSARTLIVTLSADIAPDFFDNPANRETPLGRNVLCGQNPATCWRDEHGEGLFYNDQNVRTARPLTAGEYTAHIGPFTEHTNRLTGDDAVQDVPDFVQETVTMGANYELENCVCGTAGGQIGFRGIRGRCAAGRLDDLRSRDPRVAIVPPGLPIPACESGTFTTGPNRGRIPGTTFIASLTATLTKPNFKQTTLTLTRERRVIGCLCERDGSSFAAYEGTCGGAAIPEIPPNYPAHPCLGENTLRSGNVIETITSIIGSVTVASQSQTVTSEIVNSVAATTGSVQFRGNVECCASGGGACQPDTWAEPQCSKAADGNCLCGRAPYVSPTRPSSDGACPAGSSVQRRNVNVDLDCSAPASTATATVRTTISAAEIASLTVDAGIVTTTVTTAETTETRSGRESIQNCCRGNSPRCLSGFNQARCDDGGDGVCHCNVDTIHPASSASTTPSCPAGQFLSPSSRADWSIQCTNAAATMTIVSTTRVALDPATAYNIHISINVVTTTTENIVNTPDNLPTTIVTVGLDSEGETRCCRNYGRPPSRTGICEANTWGPITCNVTLANGDCSCDSTTVTIGSLGQFSCDGRVAIGTKGRIPSDHRFSCGMPNTVTIRTTTTTRITTATPVVAPLKKVGRVTSCQYRRLDARGNTMTFATVNLNGPNAKPEEFGCENTQSGYCSCDGVAVTYTPEIINTEFCECQDERDNVRVAGLVQAGQCNAAGKERNSLHLGIVAERGSGGRALDLAHCKETGNFLTLAFRASDPTNLTVQRPMTATLTQNGAPEAPTCRGAYDRDISPIEPIFGYEDADSATPYECHPTAPRTVTSYAEAPTVEIGLTTTLTTGFTLGLSQFGPTYLRLGGSRGPGMALVAHHEMLTMSPIISYRGLTYLEQSERVGGQLEPIDRHRAVIPPGTRGDIFGNVTGRDGLNFGAELLPADTAEFLKNFPMGYAVAPQCRAEGGGGEFGGEDGKDCAEGGGEGLEFFAERGEDVVLEEEMVAKGNILLTAASPDNARASDDIGISLRVYSRSDFYSGDLTSPRAEGLSRAAYINAQTGMPTFYGGSSGAVTLAGMVEPSDVVVFSLLDGAPSGAEIRAYMLPLAATLALRPLGGNTLTMQARLDPMTTLRIRDGREHYAVMGSGATVHAGGYTPGFAQMAEGVITVTTVPTTSNVSMTTNLRIGPGAVVIGDRRRSVAGGLSGRDIFGRDSFIAWEGANIPLENYLVVSPQNYTMEVEPASRYASFDFAGNPLVVADVGDRITAEDNVALAGPPAVQTDAFMVSPNTAIPMEPGYLWQGYISAKGGRAAATMHFSHAADLAASDGLDSGVYLRVQPQAELLNFWGSGRERLEGLDSRSIARSPGRVGIFDGVYFRKDQVSLVSDGMRVDLCRYVHPETGANLDIGPATPYSQIILGETYNGDGANIACQNRTGDSPWCRCTQPIVEIPVCEPFFHGRADMPLVSQSTTTSANPSPYTCVRPTAVNNAGIPTAFEQPITASVGLDNFTPTDEVPDRRLFEDDVHYQRWQKQHADGRAPLAEWAVPLTMTPAGGTAIPDSEEVFVYAGQPPRWSGFRSPVVNNEAQTVLLELWDENGNLVGDEVVGTWLPKATELRDFQAPNRPKFPHRTNSAEVVTPAVLASITMRTTTVVQVEACSCIGRDGIRIGPRAALVGTCQPPPRAVPLLNHLTALTIEPSCVGGYVSGAYDTLPDIIKAAGAPTEMSFTMTTFATDNEALTVTMTTQVHVPFVPAVPEIVVTTTNTGKERFPVASRRVACTEVATGTRTEIAFKLIYDGPNAPAGRSGQDADCLTSTPNTSPPTAATNADFAGGRVAVSPPLRNGFCGANRLVDQTTGNTLYTAELGNLDYTCIVNTVTMTTQMTMEAIQEIPEITRTITSALTLTPPITNNVQFGLIPPFAVPMTQHLGWLTWGFNNSPYAIPDQSYLDDGGEVWALRQMFNPYDLRQSAQPDDSAEIVLSHNRNLATVKFNPPPFQMAGRRLAPHYAPSYPKFAHLQAGVDIRPYDGAPAAPRKCIDTAAVITTVRTPAETRLNLQACNCFTSATDQTEANRIEGAVLAGQCAVEASAVTGAQPYNFLHLEKLRNPAIYPGAPLDLSQCAGLSDFTNPIDGSRLTALPTNTATLHMTLTTFIPSGNSPFPQRRVQGALLGTAGDVERTNRGTGLNCSNGDIRSAAFSSRLRRNAVLATYAEDEADIGDTRTLNQNALVATVTGSLETNTYNGANGLYIVAVTATVETFTLTRQTLVSEYQCRSYTTALGPPIPPATEQVTMTTYSNAREGRCTPTAGEPMPNQGGCAANKHCLPNTQVVQTRRMATLATLMGTVALADDFHGGSDGRITLSGNPSRLPEITLTLRRGERLHYQYFLATANRRQLDGDLLNNNVVDIPTNAPGLLSLRNQLDGGTTALAPHKLTLNQLPVRLIPREVTLSIPTEYCQCRSNFGTGDSFNAGLVRQGECNPDQFGNLHALGYIHANALAPGECNLPNVAFNLRPFSASPAPLPRAITLTNQVMDRVRTLGPERRGLVAGQIILPNPPDAREIVTRIAPGGEVRTPTGANPNNFMGQSPATLVGSTAPKNQTVPGPYRPYTVFLQPETPAAAVEAAMSREFAPGETRTARLDSDMYIYLDRAYNTLAPVDNSGQGGGDYQPIPPQMFRFGDAFKIRGPAALVPHFGGRNRSAVAQTYAARSRFMHEVIGSDDLLLHEKYSEANFACSTELSGDGAAPVNCPALYNPDNAPFWIPIISGVMALEGVEVSVESSAPAAAVAPDADSSLDLMFVLPQPSAEVQAADGTTRTIYAGSILRPRDNMVIPAMPITEPMQLVVKGTAYAAVDVSPVSPPTPVRMIRDEPFMRSWDFNFAPVRATLGGTLVYAVPKRFGGHDVIDFREARGQRILTGFGGADNEPVYAYNAPPTGLPFWCKERDSWACNPYNARAWAGAASGRNVTLLNKTQWRIANPVSATLRYDGTLARGFLINARMATLFADYYQGASVWTPQNQFTTYFPRRAYAPPYAQQNFLRTDLIPGNEVAPLGNPLSWHWLTRNPNGSFIPLGGARQFSARYEHAMLAAAGDRSIYTEVPDAAVELGCGGEENINVGRLPPTNFGAHFALFPDVSESGTGANKVAPPTPAKRGAANNPFAKLPCAGDAAHYWVGLRAGTDSTEFPHPTLTMQADTDEFVALRLAHRIVLTAGAQNLTLPMATYAANGGYPTRASAFFEFPQGAVAEILNVDAASWESVHPYAAKFLSGEILSNQGGFFPQSPAEIPRVRSEVVTPVVEVTMQQSPAIMGVSRRRVDTRCCALDNFANTPFSVCEPNTWRTFCNDRGDGICDCATDIISSEPVHTTDAACNANREFTGLHFVPNWELTHACVERRAGVYLTTITTAMVTTVADSLEPESVVVPARLITTTRTVGETTLTLTSKVAAGTNAPTVEELPQTLSLQACSCDIPGAGGRAVETLGEVPLGECEAGGNDDILAGRPGRLGIDQCTGNFKLWTAGTGGFGGSAEIGTRTLTLMLTVGNPAPVSRVRRFLAGLEEMEVQAVNDGWRRLDVGGRRVLHYARTESAPGDYARTNTPVRTNVWIRLPFGGQLVGMTTTINLDPQAVVNPVLGTYLPGVVPREEETSDIPETQDKLIANYHAFASFGEGQETEIVRPALIIPKGKTVRIGETGGRIVNVKAAAFFSMTPLPSVECQTGGIASGNFFGDGTPGSGGLEGNLRVINQAREGVAGGDSVFTAADGAFGLGHPCAWLDDRENTDGDRFFVYRSRRRYLEPYRTRVISNDRTFLLGGRLELTVPGIPDTANRPV